MLVFISCLVSVLLFRLSDDVDADHPDIYLFCSFLFLKVPLQSACEDCLTSLTVFLCHCLSIFLPSLTGNICPAVVFTLWSGNERKWEFICIRDTRGREESNFSDPKKENISVGCRQITTNERMYCFMLKLCCSHAKKSKTRIIVSINWAEKIVKGGREKEYFASIESTPIHWSLYVSSQVRLMSADCLYNQLCS